MGHSARGFHSLRRLWGAYERALGVAPVLTQAASSACIWGLGDMAAQRVQNRDGQRRGEAVAWDARQTVNTVGYGGLFVGPCGHFWYQGLDKTARRLFPGGVLTCLGFKIAADTLVFGSMHIAAMFAFMELQRQGGSLWTAVRKIEQDFLPVFVAECAFWPPFQAVNFMKVPVQHQLLAVNIACLLDAAFLNWAKNQDVRGLVKSWSHALPRNDK
jgi:protein Mpv17